MPAALLKHWTDRMQASGRYSFLRAAAVRDSELTPSAVSMALRHAVKDGRFLSWCDYSEDIDRVQSQAGPAGPLIDS
jgi:hypothetical protein